MNNVPPLALACLVASLAACGAPRPAVAPTSGAAPSLPDAQRSPPAAPTFVFRSGFWVHVHQSLHYAATARRPTARRPTTWSAPTAPAWLAAVDFYRQRFGDDGGMGVLFNDELVGLNPRLSDLDADASPGDIDPELARHLARAGEVLRARWPEDDRNNTRWIDGLAPLLDAHGDVFRDELVAIYGVPWPAGPIRVDVACFAGPVGAYTIESPLHITISSCDPNYAGEAALEMIFHEASHALVGPLTQKIVAAAARLGSEAPPHLWHAVIFYTAGELARRRLGPSYVPYAARNGLWGGPMGDVEPLERAWQPYLDGEANLDEATHALVEAAASAEE
jgi:hypothetical protein